MATVNELVQQGITAIKAGRRAEAKQFLTQAVELDEQHEQAWLWLSGCVDTAEEQQICLENVLAINPANDKARKGLAQITKQGSSQTSLKPPPASSASLNFSSIANDPVSGASSDNPFGSGSGWEPSGNDGFGDSFSDSFGGNSSTPARGGAYGSGKDVQLPSSEELDSWVSGLSLGGNDPAFDTDASANSFSFGGSSSAAPDPFGSDTSAFGGGDFGSSDFGSDPFGSSSFDNSTFDSNTFDNVDDPFSSKGKSASASVNPFDFGSSPSASTGNKGNKGNTANNPSSNVFSFDVDVDSVLGSMPESDSFDSDPFSFGSDSGSADPFGSSSSKGKAGSSSSSDPFGGFGSASKAASDFGRDPFGGFTTSSSADDDPFADFGSGSAAKAPSGKASKADIDDIFNLPVTPSRETDDIFASVPGTAGAKRKAPKSNVFGGGSALDRKQSPSSGGFAFIDQSMSPGKQAYFKAIPPEIQAAGVTHQIDIKLAAIVGVLAFFNIISLAMLLLNLAKH